jgi:hypothetical protein
MDKVHPADVFEADVINRATQFRARRFCGRGRWETREDMSRRYAESLSTSGAGWLVYAVDAQGRSALLSKKSLALAAGRATRESTP